MSAARAAPAPIPSLPQPPPLPFPTCSGPFGLQPKANLTFSFADLEASGQAAQAFTQHECWLEALPGRRAGVHGVAASVWPKGGGSMHSQAHRGSLGLAGLEVTGRRYHGVIRAGSAGWLMPPFPLLFACRGQHTGICRLQQPILLA
jgi:hypothetical protein